MKIDRNNYEIYFLDYLEGRLTAEETAELLIFANENPDLRELIESEELITLVPDDAIHFHPKSALIKGSISEDESDLKNEVLLTSQTELSGSGINSQNCEEFMIRFYENELTDSEKAALADFLKENPSSLREFEIFGITLLKPDTRIVYPHKYRLKRNILTLHGVKKIAAIVSVAASVLLFALLFLKYIYQPLPKANDKKLAQTVKINKGNQSGKVLFTKSYRAKIQPAQFSRPNLSYLNPKAPILKANTFEERQTFELQASFNIRQPLLLPTTPINIPRSIARRTDFDGITSTAYFDPDPDAQPLNSTGRTIGGRLGYTLAKGIAQTAGTIGREPEVGRLIRGKISLSDIAGFGLAGYNLITDSKLSISREYDSNGNLKGYSLYDGNKRLTRLP